MAARVFVGIPNLSLDQNVIACKWFMALFLTDDPLERLFTQDDWWCILGRKFCENLSIIYSGCFDGKLALNSKNFGAEKEKFLVSTKREVPQKITHALVRAFKLHYNLEREMVHKLHPAIYGACCSWIRHYLYCLNKEQPLFRDCAVTGQFLDASESQHLRQVTFGFPMIACSLFQDPAATRYLTITDSLTAYMAWISALENDIVSSPKDSFGNDFSPNSVTNHLMQKNSIDHLTAVRMLLNQVNDSKMAVKSIIQTMDTIRRPHYEFFHLLLNSNLDFHFRTGIHGLNTRYGWTPLIDE